MAGVPDEQQPERHDEPARLTGRGRTIEPVAGDGATTFLSTAMIVAGIGLAWPGLLLSAAGGVLAVIDLREFKRLNPWLFPSGADEPTPLMAPEVMRISRWALISIVFFAGAALACVIATGNRLTVLGPALLAGVVAVAQDRRLKAQLQAVAARA